MKWLKPHYENNRFGFEVTMYIGLSLNLPKARPRSLKTVLAAALLASAIPLVTRADHQLQGNDWPSYGGDLQNTGQAGSPKKIDANSVNLIDGMRVKWLYETTPVTFIGNDADEDFDLDPKKAAGAILSPPAVSKDGYLYFADTLGYIHALNKNFTGSDPNHLTDLNSDNDPKTWKTFAPTAYSQPGKYFLFSRNTPALDEKNNTLFFGNQSNPYLSIPLWCDAGIEPSIAYDPSFEAIRAQCAASSMNTPLGEKYGIGNGVPTDGAILIAVNRLNGQLKWSTKLDKHPWASPKHHPPFRAA